MLFVYLIFFFSLNLVYELWFLRLFFTFVSCRICNFFNFIKTNSSTKTYLVKKDKELVAEPSIDNQVNTIHFQLGNNSPKGNNIILLYSTYYLVTSITKLNSLKRQSQVFLFFTKLNVVRSILCICNYENERISILM